MTREVLRVKEDRMSEIVLFGQPSRARGKSRSSAVGLVGCHNERFKGNGTSQEGPKKEALDRLG